MSDNNVEQPAVMSFVDGWGVEGDIDMETAPKAHLDQLPPTPIPGLAMAVENVVDAETANAIYEYSVAHGKPWGVYLTLHGSETDVTEERLQAGSKAMPLEQVELARKVVDAFWLQRLYSLLVPVLKEVHGFELWVLTGEKGSKCDYHLDFAESYRLDDNHIATPLYSSCLHPSPLNAQPESAMQGGDFAVNVGGVEHYKRFGHKYRLVTPEEAEADRETSADWVRVRYKHRRGVVFDGCLPHMSTPVLSLPDGIRRVVVGINVYHHATGELVADCPVHSQKQREDHMYTMLRQDLFGDA